MTGNMTVVYVIYFFYFYRLTQRLSY